MTFGSGRAQPPGSGVGASRVGVSSAGSSGGSGCTSTPPARVSQNSSDFTDAVPRQAGGRDGNAQHVGLGEVHADAVVDLGGAAAQQVVVQRGTADEALLAHVSPELHRGDDRLVERRALELAGSARTAAEEVLGLVAAGAVDGEQLGRELHVVLGGLAHREPLGHRAAESRAERRDRERRDGQICRSFSHSTCSTSAAAFDPNPAGARNA